jgi:helix-turn-helix protein
VSDEAVKWASDQVCPSGRAKDVLKFFARHADEEGVAWAAIPTIAEDMQMSERQAQRLVRDLVNAGFMAPTGKFKYRNIPFYALALEREGALAAVRAARRAALIEARKLGRTSPVEKRANGDVDVTVGLWGVGANGDTGVTVENANGDIRDANGDMGVTQRRVDEEEGYIFEGAQALEDAGSPDFEGLPGDTARRAAAETAEAGYRRLSGRWIEVAPGRVDDPKARMAFSAQLAEGEEADIVVGGGLRFLAESPDAKSGRVPMLHTWLAGKRWRGFEPKAGSAEGGAAAAAPTFDGPAELLSAVAAIKDRDWFVSYLAQCGWDEAARAIVAPRQFTADRIAGDLRALLAEHRINVIVRKAAA